MSIREENSEMTPSEEPTSASPTQDEDVQDVDPRIRRANAEAARYRVERNTARQQVASLETQLENLRDELTAQHQQAVEDLQQQLERAQQTTHEAQLRQWRMEAVGRAGLPPELADRLQGDDPEAIVTDAERLARLFPLRKTLRTGHASQSGSPTRAQQIFNRIEGRSDNLFELIRQTGHGGGAFDDSNPE
jgi:hypothetical protein